MVRLNNSDFPLYEQDTKITILERIAYSLNTLPKYLYFPDGIPDITQLRGKNNIKVENILETITTYSSELNFTELWENIEEKIIQQNLNIMIDVLQLFIILNDSLQTSDDTIRNTMLLVLENQLESISVFSNISIHQLEDITREGEIIRDKLKIDLKNIKTKVSQQLKIFSTIQDTKQIPYTEFELERMDFELTLDIQNMSIIEIFNLIQLSSEIPFCALDKFYKILKDFTPDESWAVTIPNMIILKVLQRKLGNLGLLKDYVDIFIQEKGEGIFTIIGTLYIEQNYLSKKDILDRIFSSLNIEEYKIINIEDYNIRGAFYYPQSTLNYYVLKDLILNNSIFSSVLGVDESAKATTEKDSMYMHFFNAQIGNVKCVLTEKISHKKDTILKGKDVVKTFPYGKEYIRVRISMADNISAIKEFQNIFSRLLSIYYDEYNSIVTFYKQFIPTFAEKILKKIPDTIVLKNKDIAPEIFAVNYPSKCPKAPTIISDEDLEQNADGTYKKSLDGIFYEKDTNKMVMRYPLTEDEGFIPRNYVCNWEKHIYPGLTKKNVLSNKDLTQFLPCCYEKNHTTPNAGTSYRYYYFDEDMNITKQIIQKQFIITGRILPPKFYGLLPEDDLAKNFELFLDDDKFKMLRKGIFKTSSSILECILIALWEEKYKDFFEMDTIKEHDDYLMKLRQKMATRILATTCKQEMYDFSIEEILEILVNPKVYLDPSHFIHMLELYFDCTIYVFSRSKNKLETKLITPRHLQSYYRNKTEKRTIFIYEHWGNKSDSNIWPHCELIVQSKRGKDDETIDIFDWNSKIVNNVKYVFNKLNNNYSLNIHNEDTVFPIDHPNINFVSQSIDSYGKCRLLHFLYKNEVLGTFLITPIAPLMLPENNIWVVTPIKNDIALEIIKDLGIQITKQNVVNDISRGYTGILGNVHVTLPIEDSVPNMDIPEIEEGVGYPENNISVLEQFNKYKKLSRYITAYTFWLYSKFLHDTGKIISLETMNEFQKKYIRLIPEWNYDGSVGKIFDINNTVLLNKKQLIVKSEETLKRLMYILRINIQKIPDYYKKIVIENYYEDVTDFDKHQFQIILQGEQSIEKWITERNTKTNLHNSIQPELINPYFFKNSLIGPEIWLAQNTDSITKALEIWKIWQNSNYNTGTNIEESVEETNNYTLYSYKNNNDIIKYQVGTLQENIKIIGYKIDEEMFFTTLLPL